MSIFDIVSSFKHLTIENSDTREEFPYTMVDTKEKAKKGFNDIVNNSKREIAFDVEGKDLSRFGEIVVVQVGFDGEKPYLYKIKELDSNTIKKYLKPILESEEILKICFDCRIDSDALYHQLKITLCNVFDLQVLEQGILRSCGQFSTYRNRYLPSMRKLLTKYGCKKKSLYNSNWNFDCECESFYRYSSMDIYLMNELHGKMKKKYVTPKVMLRVKAGCVKYLKCDRDSSIEIPNDKSHALLICI